MSLRAALAASVAALGLVSLPALAAGPASPALPDSGYGAVRFGDRLAVVEKRLGQRAEPLDHDPGCAMLQWAQYPGIQFMVEDGIVTRADAQDASIRNSAGITEGTTVTEAVRRVPRIRSEPAPDDTVDLKLVARDGKRAFRFTTNQGKITGVRAGLLPSVDYVEHCW